MAEPGIEPGTSGSAARKSDYKATEAVHCHSIISPYFLISPQLLRNAFKFCERDKCTYSDIEEDFDRVEEAK
jgi:hypothetical protein